MTLSDEIRSDYIDNIELSLDYYITEDGNNISFPIVDAVSHSIAQDPTLDHEYLPMLGLSSFRQAVTRLLLGLNSIPYIENRVVCTQTVDIAGGLRIAAEFLKVTLNFNTIHIPSFAGDEVLHIFRNFEYEVNTLPYWNNEKRQIDIDELCSNLEKIKNGELCFLENSGQNRSGAYPSMCEWDRILEIIVRKRIFVIFGDVQSGLCHGSDFSIDFYPIRKLAEYDHEFMVCQSFTKTLSLQNNPIGSLTLVLKVLVQLTEYTKV